MQVNQPALCDNELIVVHINGNFLLVLVLGIFTSILTLARLISWLLEHHPVPLWAFFFGLILASALVLLRQVERWTPSRLFFLLVGAAFAGLIAVSPVVGMDGGLASIFLAGFLAICAMILPGISGRFILVLLGMYGTVLAAVKSLDLLPLAVLALGAVCGLLCFSRVLHYLLHMLFIIPVFWLQSRTGLRDIGWSLSRFSGRPDRIFRGWVRRALVSVLPYAFVASYPVRGLLEGMSGP